MSEQPKKAKRGWLTKLGARAKNWKKRYFVLGDGRLTYYKTAVQDDKGKKGTILLTGAVADFINSSEYDLKFGPRTAFSVQVAGMTRTYVLVASSTKDRDEWIHAIREAAKDSAVVGEESGEICWSCGLAGHTTKNCPDDSDGPEPSVIKRPVSAAVDSTNDEEVHGHLPSINSAPGPAQVPKSPVVSPLTKRKQKGFSNLRGMENIDDVDPEVYIMDPKCDVIGLTEGCLTELLEGLEMSDKRNFMTGYLKDLVHLALDEETYNSVIKKAPVEGVSVRAASLDPTNVSSWDPTQVRVELERYLQEVLMPSLRDSLIDDFEQMHSRQHPSTQSGPNLPVVKKLHANGTGQDRALSMLVWTNFVKYIQAGGISNTVRPTRSSVTQSLISESAEHDLQSRPPARSEVDLAKVQQLKTDLVNRMEALAEQRQQQEEESRILASPSSPSRGGSSGVVSTLTELDSASPSKTTENLVSPVDKPIPSSGENRADDDDDDNNNGDVEELEESHNLGGTKQGSATTIGMGMTVNLSGGEGEIEIDSYGLDESGDSDQPDSELIEDYYKFTPKLPPSEEFPAGDRYWIEKRAPLCDISVVFHKKHPKDLPEGFSLLQRSFGDRGANLNKGTGGYHVYLCYKRLPGRRALREIRRQARLGGAIEGNSNFNTTNPPSDLRAITAITVISPERDEELPYGFQVVGRTVGGEKANLNVSTNGPAMYLCVCKGQGAPLIDIQVRYGDKYHGKTQELPVGWHELTLTPAGNSADVNTGTGGFPTFLCFQADISSVMRKYKAFATNKRESCASSKVSEGYARCLASLTACLYCFDQSLVIHALLCFKQLPVKLTPKPLLNEFMRAVADAAPCFRTYFDPPSTTFLLHFVYWSFQTYLSVFEVDVILKLLEVCTLNVTVNEESKMSISIIDHVFAHLQSLEVSHDERLGNQDISAPLEVLGMARDTLEKLAEEIVFANEIGHLVRNFIRSKFQASQMQVRGAIIALGEALFAGSADTGWLGSHKKIAIVMLFYLQISLSNLPRVKRQALSHICYLIDKAADYEQTLNARLATQSGFRSTLSASSPSYFRSRSGTFLLRVGLTVMCHTCVGQDLEQAFFEYGAEAICKLFKHFHTHLLLDLGVVFDGVLLRLLESSLTTLNVKSIILRHLSKVIDSSTTVVGLFNNYDNQAGGIWDSVLPHNALFQNLLNVLGQIAEHRPEEIPRKQPLSEEDREREAVMAAISVSEYDMVRHEALKILCTLFGFLTKFVKSSKPVTEHSVAAAVKQSTVITSDDWRARWETRTALNEFTHSSLVAANENLKNLIKIFKARAKDNQRDENGPEVARDIGNFLYFQRSWLDPAALGDILSTFDDRAMTPRQWAIIREQYHLHLDFQGMSFDRAMRTYLTAQGFRLPGEAQKIDRLLEAFCKRFCVSNPRVFRNANSAFIVAFALVMLNTDIHDPRLRQDKKGKQRKPMSEDDFVKNLRGVDDGGDFPRQFLVSLYGSIKQEGIVWSGLPSSPPTSPAQSSISLGEKLADVSPVGRRGGHKPPAQYSSGGAIDQVAQRKELASLLRGVWHSLRKALPYRVKSANTSDPAIIAPIFQQSWRSFLSALTVCGQTPNTNILNLCIGGLTDAVFLAKTFHMPNEEQELSALLHELENVVKLHYIKAAIMASDLLKNRRYRLKLYPKCLVASKLIDWFIDRNHAADRKEGVRLGMALSECGLVCAIPPSSSSGSPEEFKDGKLLYHFQPLAKIDHRATFVGRKLPRESKIRDSVRMLHISSLKQPLDLANLVERERAIKTSKTDSSRTLERPHKPDDQSEDDSGREESVMKPRHEEEEDLVANPALGLISGDAIPQTSEIR